MKIQGINDVIIERTKDGVPLVEATSESDMHFGFRYCHAICVRNWNSEAGRSRFELISRYYVKKRNEYIDNQIHKSIYI